MAVVGQQRAGRWRSLGFSAFHHLRDTEACPNCAAAIGFSKLGVITPRLRFSQEPLFKAPLIDELGRRTQSFQAPISCNKMSDQRGTAKRDPQVGTFSGEPERKLECRGTLSNYIRNSISGSPEALHDHPGTAISARRRQ